MKSLEDGYYKLGRDDVTDKEIIEYVPVSSSDPDGIMLCFLVVAALSCGTLFGFILLVATLLIDTGGVLELVQN